MLHNYKTIIWLAKSRKQVSMINHSCEPNITWTFEGRELRVITTQPIAAGEEVNFSYIGGLGNYQKRRQLLKERWSFNCVCPLCNEGPKGLCSQEAGELGKRILALMESGWPDTYEKSEKIKRAREALETAGYGPETYPMRWLYRCIWACESFQGEWEAALKTSLKIFYLVSTQPERNRVGLYLIIVPTKFQDLRRSLGRTLVPLNIS
jgi:hypothetical protein